MFLLIALFATVINGLPLSHMGKTNLAWESGLECVNCNCRDWDGHNYSNCSAVECTNYCVKCQADGTTPMPGFYTRNKLWCQRYTDGCLHLADKDHEFDLVDGYCCQDDHQLSEKVCCQHGPLNADGECPEETMDLKYGQMMGKGVACDDGTELDQIGCRRAAADMELCDTGATVVSSKYKNKYPAGCSYKPADSSPCSKNGGKKLYWNAFSESSYLLDSTTHSKRNLCKPAGSEDELKCEDDEQKVTLGNQEASCCKYSHTRLNGLFEPEECCNGPTEYVNGKNVCPAVQTIEDCTVAVVDENYPDDYGSGPCVFPFSYQGTLCEGPTCCDMHDGDGPWCATEVDDNDEVVELGYCDPKECVGKVTIGTKDPNFVETSCKENTTWESDCAGKDEPNCKPNDGCEWNEVCKVGTLNCDGNPEVICSYLERCEWK